MRTEKIAKSVVLVLPLKKFSLNKKASVAHAISVTY